MTDLKMYRRDTAVFLLPVTRPDDDGVEQPVDLTLTGTRVTFSAKYFAQDPDVDRVMQKTETDGITLAGNVATIRLEPADTENVPNIVVSLLWDVQVVEPDETVTTVAGGTLIINPDIS